MLHVTCDFLHISRSAHQKSHPGRRTATQIRENSASASEIADNSMLVPSGRFKSMETCARDLVQLWDLGTGANSSIRSNDVACTVFKGRGEGLQVDVVGLRRDKRGCEMCK